MCGIVGYIGDRNHAVVGIQALKELEERGYDSVGGAIDTGESIQVFKAVGTVRNLESELVGFNGEGGRSVWHTRWATHGKISKENAHPHSDCTGRFWVVHNGIVEGSRELRSWLARRGHVFRSETDTEVLPHLFEELYDHETRGDVFGAVRRALERIEGAYGIVVLAQDAPGQLIAARRGSPLIIGVGEDEHFVASERAALGAYTAHTIPLDDGEIAILKRGDYTVFNLRAELIVKAAELGETPREKDEGLGPYPNHTTKEIFAQPEVVEECLRGRILAGEGRAKLGGIRAIEERLRAVEDITIVACGTAYYAGFLGKYLVEEFAGIPTSVELASEFAGRRPLLRRTSAVIAISQSGETKDTLLAVQHAKSRGVLTLGIVNRVGTEIPRETGVGIYVRAGRERGVASTKAFLAQVTALMLLAVELGRQRDLSGETAREILEALHELPQVIRGLLAETETLATRTLAERYKEARNFLYLGRGLNYPIALEGALKLKELCPSVHAEGYAGGEMKHGPIALIDSHFPTLAIVPQDNQHKKMVSNMAEIHTRGGPIVALAHPDDDEVRQYADHVIEIPPTPHFLTPMVAVVPLQLFACFMAELNGFDADHPRNLAKAVTVE